MAMPAGLQDQEWTVERALALPDDGNRYEVLDGELFVTPSPTWGHQSAISAIHPVLRAYVRAHGLGWAMLSPADIVISPRRLVQPDLFVVPWREGGAPAGRPARRADLAAARGPAALPAGARGVLRGVGRVDVRPSPLVD